MDATILDLKKMSQERPDGSGEGTESVPFQLVEQKPSFNGGDANEFSKR